MSTIAASTCDLHRDRSATARCPQCRRFFCAECITEHHGRLSCASCLEAECESSSEASEEKVAPRRRLSLVLFQCVLGLVLCWGIYYALARLLMAIPADFHDGTLWEE